MPIRPRETITRHFIVEDGTGAPVDADETPTAILRRNGAVCTNADITVTSTGTTGEYRVSATLSADDGWEEGDSYALIAQAVVSGTTFRRIVEQGNVEDLPPRRETYTDERGALLDNLAALDDVATGEDLVSVQSTILAAIGTTTGDWTVTVQLTNAFTGAPVPDRMVSLTMADMLLITRSRASSLGVVEWNLNDGDYYAIVADTAGWEHADAVPFTVSGAPEDVSIKLTPVTIPEPESADQAAVYGYALESDGSGPIAGIELSAEPYRGDWPVVAGSSNAVLDTTATSTATDETGTAILYLARGCRYRITFGSLERIITVPTSGSLNVGTVIAQERGLS